MLLSNKMAKNNWPHNAYVFIVPPGDDGEGHIFKEQGFRLTEKIEDANIVVFTGGADLDPMLYGEKLMPKTYPIRERDAREIQWWRKTSPDAMKIGICRGGQLLNVLNGGKLYQHINNHGSTHTVIDTLTRKTRVVSSTHHQSFRPAAGAVVVATTQLSTVKLADGLHWTRNSQTEETRKLDVDYEVLWYPRTRSLCFQGHPEYTSPPDTEEYFMELVKRYF